MWQALFLTVSDANAEDRPWFLCVPLKNLLLGQNVLWLVLHVCSGSEVSGPDRCINKEQADLMQKQLKGASALVRGGFDTSSD